MKALDQLIASEESISRTSLAKTKSDLLDLGSTEYLATLFGDYASGIAIDVSLGLIDWSGVNYEDLKLIIKKMGTNPIGLLHFSQFMGAFIGIDIRPDLKGSVSQESFDYIIKLLGNGPTAVFYLLEGYDSIRLKRLEVSREFLEGIKRKFLAEGAKEAVAIEPRRERLD